ncbi:MAG: hypothetical protein ACHP7F_06165 [Actinomycetales bacterium]|jgi:hypothetical protein
MSDLSSAPKAVQELAEWLTDRGSPLRAKAFDSPNNQLLQAPVEHFLVQVLADRGQWFVALAPPDADEYFATAVWSSCLAGTPVSLELTPLAAQVAWLKEFLAEDAHGDWSIECLRDARRRRAYQRMGLE